MIAFSNSFTDAGADFYEFDGKTHQITDWYSENISANENMPKIQIKKDPWQNIEGAPADPVVVE